MFESKRFDEPDNRTEFPNGHSEAVTIGDTKLIRVTYEPGFRWTSDMAATAGTERCEMRHRIHVLGGRLRLQESDGTEREIAAGDVALIEPGHDAWTVGDEPFVFVDVQPAG